MMLSNKKLNPIVTELFIRGRKQHLFLLQSYFAVPKNSVLKSMHYFIMKTPNKQELQQITLIRYSLKSLCEALQNHILL